MKRTNKKERNKKRGTKRVKGGGWLSDLFGKSASIAPASEQIAHEQVAHVPDIPISAQVVAETYAAEAVALPQCITQLKELFNYNKNLQQIIEYEKIKEKYMTFSKSDEYNELNNKANYKKISNIQYELYTNMKSKKEKLFTIKLTIKEGDIEREQLFTLKFEKFEVDYKFNKYISILNKEEINNEIKENLNKRFNTIIKYIKNYCEIFKNINNCENKIINEKLKICNEPSIINDIIYSILTDFESKIKKYPENSVAVFNNSFQSNYDEAEFNQIIKEIETKFVATYEIYKELQKYDLVVAQVAGKCKRNKSKKS